MPLLEHGLPENVPCTHVRNAVEPRRRVRHVPGGHTEGQHSCCKLHAQKRRLQRAMGDGVQVSTGREQNGRPSGAATS